MSKSNDDLKLSDIERDLSDIIGKYKLSNKLSVEKIKKIIFKDDKLSAREAFNEFQAKVLKHFPLIDDIDELNLVFQTLGNAWNYFPHAALSGKSPREVANISLKENIGDKNIIPKHLPKVVVGGREMSWDEYEEMIKEMENLQIPFKNWIDNLLKEYKKYLNRTLSPKVVQKHYEVADIFFQRVLHVGFLNLDDIPPDFIHIDIPRWWRTHVLFSSLDKKVIISSLRKLFAFIQVTTLIDIKKFGF